jgi:hypothetical protein
MELNGDHEDQHDAEPEAGHGLAEQRRGHDQLVGEPVAMGGAEDAGRHGDDHRQDERGNRQLQCRGKALHHELERRLLLVQRHAEISAGEQNEEPDVLGRQRRVQPEVAPHRFHLGRWRVPWQQHRHRVAGHADHEKDHRRDPEQDHRRANQPPGQVSDVQKMPRYDARALSRSERPGRSEIVLAAQRPPTGVISTNTRRSSPRGMNSTRLECPNTKTD